MLEVNQPLSKSNQIFNMNTPNYEEDGQKKEGNKDSLKTLSQEASKVVELQERIKKGEQLLKDLKKEVETKTRTTIPEIMQEVGMKSFHLDTGHSVNVKPFIECSIPSNTSINTCRDGDKRNELIDRKEQCFEWLEENQGGGLISDVITIPIPKGDEVFRSSVLDVLENQGFNFSEDKTVHAGSLKKFLKEKLELGGEVPKELFSLFQGERAEIK